MQPLLTSPPFAKRLNLLWMLCAAATPAEPEVVKKGKQDAEEGEAPAKGAKK